MRAACLLAAVWLIGCGGPAPRAEYQGSVFRKGDERFRVDPPPMWERVAGRGDLAWRAPDGAGVIAANAECHGHKDAPLSVLVNDLVLGTTRRRVLLDETAKLDDRDARHEVIALELDGVPLVYDVYVIKKDGCVYDLTLVCPPRAYDRVADTFVAFVSGFHGAGAGPGE